MMLFLQSTMPKNWNEILYRDSSVVGIAFNRSQRNFTERDRIILKLLQPHVSQAYINAQHYQKLQDNLSLVQQTLNHLDLVILDSDGKIQLVTPQARSWLETYFSKSPSSNQLPNLLWSWVKHQVSLSNNNELLPKTRLPIRVQLDRKQLVIRLVVEQSSNRYLLLMEEQNLSLLSVLELLGLSQRETEVLFLVMQGKDNKSIAKIQSVNISTIRKQLESIYRKFDVTSRSEALAKALEKLGFLHSLPLN